MYPSQLSEKDTSLCAVKFYTFQRENGGSYQIINQSLQVQNEGGSSAGIWERNMGTQAIVCGFQYLHKHNPEFVNTIPNIVWRGMKKLTDEQWSSFEIGADFYWASFVSTTESFWVAKSFTQNDPDEKGADPLKESALFKIELKGERTYALHLNDAKITMFPNEEEILL